MNNRADSPAPPPEPQVPSDTLLQGLESYAVITLDTSGKILEWSTGAETIFGYAASEIIGQPFSVLFTPEDQAANRPAQELSGAAGGDTSEDQRWHVRKDGTRIWVSGTVRAAWNESGELTSFVKIAREITSHKLAELQREALLQREQQARAQAEQSWKRLEEISENIPAVIGLVRLPEQVYVFANRIDEMRRSIPGDATLSVIRRIHSVQLEIRRSTLEKE
jgi:PAS domain S-box-containing protein